MLAFNAIVGAAARAEEPMRAEGTDFELGESELELQSIANIYDAGTEIETQIQFEHGIAENWSIGAESEFEREAGDTLKASSIIASTKWRPPLGNDSAFAIAFQLGAGIDLEEDRFLVQTAAFGSLQQGDWLLGGRLRMTARPGSGSIATFDYRSTVERNLSEAVVVGIRMAGDLRSDDPAEHRIGPTLSADIGGDAELELGLFAGLNRASPDAVLNAEISWEF